MPIAPSRVSLPESFKMKAPLSGPCHPAAQPPHYKDRKQTFHALINHDPSGASFQVDRAMSNPHERPSRLCLQKETTGPHPHSALSLSLSLGSPRALPQKRNQATHSPTRGPTALSRPDRQQGTAPAGAFPRHRADLSQRKREKASTLDGKSRFSQG